MDGFGGGGGFGGSGESPSRGGSSDGQRPRRNYDEQTLIPVTIKMVLNAYGDPSGQGEMALKDGRPLHMVKLVAAVRGSEDRSTNLVIDIEDGTGFAQVKVWVNEGDDCSAVTNMRRDASQEHTYIRIIGQVKEYDGQRQIVANDVRPVSTGNELTYHLLEVAHSFEKYEKAKKMQSEGGGMGYGIGNMASAPPQGGGGVGIKAQGGMGAGDGESNVDDAVLQVIKAMGANSDSGIHVDQIKQQISSQGFSENNILKSISHLQNEGHIYSTIDEFHVQYAE